jgi:hypothetical protein
MERRIKHGADGGRDSAASSGIGNQKRAIRRRALLILPAFG